MNSIMSLRLQATVQKFGNEKKRTKRLLDGSSLHERCNLDVLFERSKKQCEAMQETD